MNKFFVFMCPQCQHFTNAPVSQKRRRCSYCGTIIDITKAARALVDDHDAAANAVRAYNASKGGDEFEKAVDRSRDRVRELVPTKKLTADEISSEDNMEVPTGKRSRLLSLLDKHARDEPLTLTKLEELCSDYKLDWLWVEKQLTTMANGGVLIFPRPWTVKLVKIPDKKLERESTVRDISKDILVLLKRKEDGLTIQAIIEYFESSGISSASVEASLEKLMRSGDIYEPRPGYIDLA